MTVLGWMLVYAVGFVFTMWFIRATRPLLGPCDLPDAIVVASVWPITLPMGLVAALYRFVLEIWDK